MSKRNKGQHTSTGTSFIQASEPVLSQPPTGVRPAELDAAVLADEAELEVAPTDKFFTEWLPRASTSETPLTDTLNRMREQRDEQRRQAWIDQAFIAFAAKGHPLCKAWKEAQEAWSFRARELAKQ